MPLDQLKSAGRFELAAIQLQATAGRCKQLARFIKAESAAWRDDAPAQPTAELRKEKYEQAGDGASEAGSASNQAAYNLFMAAQEWDIASDWYKESKDDEEQIEAGENALVDRKSAKQCLEDGVTAYETAAQDYVNAEKPQKAKEANEKAAEIRERISEL